MNACRRLSALLPIAVVVMACSEDRFAAGPTEFCLTGHYDLGARFQGLRPEAGEPYPMRWCVLTDDDTGRVRYTAAGNINPDMDNGWAVAYLPPDTVRIVNRDAPPDVEFSGVERFDGARRIRRLDPRRLLEEWQAENPATGEYTLTVRDGRVASVRSVADFPLRGRVDVEWRWTWDDPQRPQARLLVDGESLIEARGEWRPVSDAEFEAAFVPTTGAEPIDVPGERWPSHSNMRLIEMADDVWVVRGVRTGFQHLVVDTGDGLVVADAPAGWLELHHIPAADLAPGLGVSGLSERLVDFIHAELPGRPIRAVALTHHHDDHAGGARAFAAAGAEIFAPAEVAAFLREAFNRDSMPNDRLSASDGAVQINGVDDSITIGEGPGRVRLLSLGAGPHAGSMLGVLVPDRQLFFVSDIHVPRSEDPAPVVARADTECWFAEWAVKNLPDEVQIVNSHSAVVTPLARLQAYLDSGPCADTGDAGLGLSEFAATCAALPRPTNAALPLHAASDDWFQVYESAAGVFSIVEPYQFQETISHLILGSERALLFDTGLGLLPVRPVVERITDLPIAVLNSHTHYDHVGGNAEFDAVYAIDSDYTRANMTGFAHARVASEVEPQALCKGIPPGVDAASFRTRPWQASDFVRDGDVIDLGNRTLEVLQVPGHTPDAIALLDAGNRLLFTGDSWYDAALWLFAPETDLDDYAQSIERLAALETDVDFLFGAHNSARVQSGRLDAVRAAFGKLREDRPDPTDVIDGMHFFTVDGVEFVFSPAALAGETTDASKGGSGLDTAH